MSTAVPSASNTALVETMEAELWVLRGSAPTMRRPHRHDDLELNFVLSGALEYLFGGDRVIVESGQVAMFWAATPHRLIDQTYQAPSDVCWMHLPLSTVLGWVLPERDLGELLRSRPIIVPAAAAQRDIASMFDSWRQEVQAEQTQAIAVLEAQALVRRLLHFHHSEADEDVPRVAASSETTQRVTRMAQYAVADFRDPISVSDIARAVHLNPNYAMTLFRKSVGMTLGSYLTRCRVAEAQRLLITSSLTVSEVGHASGFGSQSSFYHHFTRACGSSPAAYRRTLR